MKRGWKHFIMGASTMAVLMGGLTFAANRSEMVERIFRDIKIKLNGTEITPKDATGKVVEPFIIDGTTYLPVRAVGEAMGLDVGWEDRTSTVKLDTKNDDTNNTFVTTIVKDFKVDGNEDIIVTAKVPQLMGHTKEIEEFNQKVVDAFSDPIFLYDLNYNVANGYTCSVLQKGLASFRAVVGNEILVCNFNPQTMKVYSNSELLKICGINEDAFMNDYLERFPKIKEKIENESYIGEGALHSEPCSLEDLKIYIDSPYGWKLAVYTEWGLESLYWSDVYYYDQNIHVSEVD